MRLSRENAAATSDAAAQSHTRRISRSVGAATQSPAHGASVFQAAQRNGKGARAWAEPREDGRRDAADASSSFSSQAARPPPRRLDAIAKAPSNFRRRLEKGSAASVSRQEGAPRQYSRNSKPRSRREDHRKLPPTQYGRRKRPSDTDRLRA